VKILKRAQNVCNGGTKMKMRRGGVHSSIDKRISPIECQTPLSLDTFVEILRANLGWVRLERFDYCGHEISVMQREFCSQANPLSQIRVVVCQNVAGNPNKNAD